MCTLFRARTVTAALLLTSLALYAISPIINKVSPLFIYKFFETKEIMKLLLLLRSELFDYLARHDLLSATVHNVTAVQGVTLTSEMIKLNVLFGSV